MQVSHPYAGTHTLAAPYTQAIANLFPDLKLLDEHWCQLRHDPGTTVLLRNLGVDTPSPVLSHYRWPHPPGKPPFEVQKETVCLLTENARAYVLSGMGVGKTVCALWAFDYLKSIGLADKMLVVCPISTMRITWMKEIFEFVPHLRGAVVYGSRAKRQDILARTDVDVYIINHDGVEVIAAELEARPDIDVLTLDELAVYRNPTERAKIMRRLAEPRTWVWGMTGSPAPHAPTDVWGQARIVTPGTVPKFFGRFRDQLMVKFGPYKYIPRHNAIEQAYAALQPSVRFQLEDVTELPPYISRRIDVDMGPKQKLVYEQIKAHCLSLIGSEEITAVNAGAALNKLMQISLGWVYASSGKVVQLDNQARIDTMLDIVNSTDGKVLLFTSFKHSLAGLEAALRKAQIDTMPAISGDTPEKKRSEILAAFQNTSQGKVLPAHPQCMSHGVTVTAADTVIWFGPITSLDIYDQANHRIRRIGQVRKQQFMHLQATATEKALYTALINHQNTQTLLLDMFRGDE